jgi:hypothetical protein
MKQKSAANCASVIDISVEIKKRRDVQCAISSEDWQQVRASFALSGVEPGKENDELVGRVLAGEITCQEALDELKAKHKVGDVFSGY